jgi:septal ring factor EnvC (AmiA/AmiB activator)
MTIADTTPHETYEGLRRQFMALRTLAASNEAIASDLRRQLKDQTQTLADLDAERATNSQLTEALLAGEAERDALKEQVRVLNEEGRTLRLSGCDIREHDLIASVMRGISGSRRNTLQRWSLVRDTFCTGSGVATALCRRFNLDPDEVLKN